MSPLFERLGLIDTHCHTKFSFDSNEEVTSYLDQTPGPVVTTEHLDFDNPVTGGDDLPDFEAYSAEWARLEKTHPGRLYKGIEVGFTKKSHDRILDFLGGKDYDLILLSIHQNGDYDYMDEAVRDLDPYEVAKDYMDRLVEASEVFKEAQVLAHIDYGFRAIDYDMDLLRRLEGDFVQALKNIIDQGIYLELNTRSIFQFDNLPLYDYVLDLYLDLGGDRFTLGSDAHFASYYRYEFERTLAFLKSKTS